MIVSTVYAREGDIPDHPEEIEEDSLLGHLSEEQILEVVQQLSPAYRTVFNLYVIENFSHKEIADQLGISEGTSKSNLAKARFQLKKNLFNKIKPADEQRTATR
jgi:RNA polymerase sigma-70 factor (ECF subfamily)